MKSIALSIALCAFCGSAVAQSTECQSIAKASERLAGYDKTASPASRGKTAATFPTPAVQSGQIADPLAAENACLDAKISNICRGC
jgi:hypothetical protein